MKILWRQKRTCGAHFITARMKKLMMVLSWCATEFEGILRTRTCSDFVFVGILLVQSLLHKGGCVLEDDGYKFLVRLKAYKSMSLQKQKWNVKLINNP